MIQMKRVLVLGGLVCVTAAWSTAAPATAPAKGPPPATAPAVVPPPEPTPASIEAHQQFSDGKYKEAVHSVARMMASKEWRAKKYDKFDMLTLKAEAHMKLKETSLAASVFDAAAKETSDKTAAALARTTAYLVKHSIGTHYVPKATADKRIPGRPLDERITIDIIESETRKEALTALWQDERNAAEPKFKAATEGSSPQAVMDAAPLIGHLHDYDLAAHGTDNDTMQAAGLIAIHGRDLLQAMVEKMGIRVDVIYSKAMKAEQMKIQVPNGRGYSSQDIWRRKGLENKEPAEVKEMISTSDKIVIAVKLLNDDLALPADFLERIAKEAKRVHDKAEKTMNENYGETFYSRPRD